jgi:hypothetical protein
MQRIQGWVPILHTADPRLYRANMPECAASRARRVLVTDLDARGADFTK